MRNIASVLCVLICCVTVGVNAPARAAVVDLAPDRDNTLFESDTGSLSNGAGPGLFVGTIEAGLERRGLLHWDLAGAVPDGATINSAVLTLHLNRANASGTPSIEARRVLADWGEGASDSSTGGSAGGQGAPAATGDATWLHRFFDTDLWTNAGGDFAAAVSANVVQNGGEFTWSGDGLTADVQGWLDNPAENFGLLLLGADGGARKFESRESADASLRPNLRITFSTDDGGGGGGGNAIPLPSTLVSGGVLLVLAGVAVVRYNSPTFARAIQPYSSPFSPRP